MKVLLTFAIIFCSTTCKAQVDSAWIADYTRSLSNDTGLYLPAINLADEKGNKRTLAEFKGKVLYIDVWTTWCANCIDRFPFGKKLFARLKSIHLDTAIQFITICSEDSKRRWRKVLKKHQPEGINLYATDTSFYKTWRVESFPHYLVIDRQGKIMSLGGPDAGDGSIDYVLYAATKGVKPAAAVFVELRQTQYHYKNSRFTDDADGIEYETWHNATAARRYADWKERDEQLKKAMNTTNKRPF